jgi:hypothetical protein
LLQVKRGSSLLLAIANFGVEHEESFKDVPRLSTIQATIILLKARESSPNRGYWFRSWMTVVTMVMMAKDLDLHEHYDLHRSNTPCTSTVSDCITKTQVWQALFSLEAMIAGSQGKPSSVIACSIHSDLVRPTQP